MNPHCVSNRPKAFTLIELLVVIAVISILASLVIPITRAVNRNKIRSKARVELRQFETAIQAYKEKLGHYPPDNPAPAGSPPRPWVNQLYYELMGTTNLAPAVFATLDGSARIASTADFNTAFGPASSVTGFVNCSGRGAGDEGRMATRFLPNLPPGEVGSLPRRPEIKYLVSSIPWPDPNVAWLPTPGLNPVRYNSSSPTNNPTTFDLWIDVIIDGKTNRISNWSQDPIIVSSPW